MATRLDLSGLSYLWDKIKAKFATKDVATTSDAGLMSASDKAKLDDANACATVGPSTIASISDAYDTDALDITIGIEPVQSGSGDPSPTNVRPISGWSGANVVVSPTTDAQDGTTYPISWETEAGTVYGGTLDVTTGLLTVTMAEVDLGTLNYTLYEVSEGTLFRTRVPLIKEGADNVNLVCSNYATIHTNRRRNNTISKASRTYVDVIDNSYSDVSAFKAAMSGVQLVYELATPQTYQLSPTEVTLLLGDNNIWANCGEMTVSYVKSDSLCINQVIRAAIGGIKPANIGAKSVQSAVSDPTASGTAVAFIDSITQNANGVITPTKKTVRSASQSESGLMSATDKARLDGIIIVDSTARTIAEGTSSFNVTGLTADHVVARWQFSGDYTDNYPPANITVTTSIGSYTITADNLMSSGITMQPIFIKP